FFSRKRRHTRSLCDWSSDVCSSDLRGSKKAGLIFLLAKTFFGDDGQRLETRLKARVFFQAHQGGRSPGRRNLIVEEPLDSAKDEAARIRPGNEVFLLCLRFAHLLIGGIDQDLKALF